MSTDHQPSPRIEKLVAMSLALATLAVFWQVRNCRFVNYDDHVYVTRNPQVQAGLTRAGAWWALTTTVNANWHPLTWLSLELDYQIYQLNAGGYHVTNLLLHTANVLLLFWLLRRMTGSLWPSAMVAALFALHPLHVQSVAWVSERKDVLSTFFLMLALCAYARYVERPGVLRYLWIFLAMALGLMAKSMLVTLPCVLLLLDYWPLQRGGVGEKPEPDATGQAPARKTRGLLILEKLPLFLLAAASCAITLYAQQEDRAVRTLTDIPMMNRLANAVMAYAGYIAKMFWPHNLAVFYPREEISWSDWRLLGGLSLLASISLASVLQARKRPYLLVGWLWYLGTLVPVIGLVQVGDQAIADRYTYVPLIGLFIMIVWSGAELAAKGRLAARAVALVGVVILFACGMRTWLEVPCWHDSIALWQRAIQATGPNAPAHYGLGVEHFTLGVEHLQLDRREDSVKELTQASREFAETIRMEPQDTRAHFMLGQTL